MQPVATTAAIGKSIVIRGELTGAEDLVVEGTVNGTIRLSGSRLTVGPEARVTAEITAREIVILGHVEGNLIAGDRVELRRTAVLHGDIATARLSIEEGATVQGKANLTGESSSPRAAGQSS